jgi:multiple sugar transport system ATP-binding protein
VILGIRPEDFEDAAVTASANGSSLDVRVTLAEAMGAELIAHFPVDARPVSRSSALAAARGEDAADSSRTLELVAADERGSAMLTARLSPRSGARAGEPLRVAIDVDRLHFFDPETESAI